jgi:hypothetical protein
MSSERGAPAILRYVGRLLLRDPVLGDYNFQVEYRTDVYAEQRGLEQILYDRYPGARLVNGGFNQIRAINPALYDKLANYIEAGFQYLDRQGPG